jgi:hypothetical protein
LSSRASIATPCALTAGVGEQLELGVGRQQDGVEQVVEAGAAFCRHVDEHRRAAVLLGDQAVLGELTADLGRVGALLVDLVDGHHDRHVGGLRVVERLDRLRLDAVVGRDDQHDDVGDLGTAGAHGGERLVARGVDEGDLADTALDGVVHLVGADVLGDAAGLALDDVGLADRVEQQGLAVVDVTHDRHDRRTGDQVGLVVVLAAEGEVEAVEQLGVLLLGLTIWTS